MGIDCDGTASTDCDSGGSDGGCDGNGCVGISSNDCDCEGSGDGCKADDANDICEEGSTETTSGTVGMGCDGTVEGCDSEGGSICGVGIPS